MTTIILTPEQIRIVEEAGDQPVRVLDPINHRAYILYREDVDHRLISTGQLRLATRSEVTEEDRRRQDEGGRVLEGVLERIRPISSSSGQKGVGDVQDS